MSCFLVCDFFRGAGGEPNDKAPMSNGILLSGTWRRNHSCTGQMNVSLKERGMCDLGWEKCDVHNWAPQCFAIPGSSGCSPTWEPYTTYWTNNSETYSVPRDIWTMMLLVKWRGAKIIMQNMTYNLMNPGRVWRGNDGTSEMNNFVLVLFHWEQQSNNNYQERMATGIHALSTYLSAALSQEVQTSQVISCNQMPLPSCPEMLGSRCWVQSGFLSLLSMLPLAKDQWKNTINKNNIL